MQTTPPSLEETLSTPEWKHASALEDALCFELPTEESSDPAEAAIVEDACKHAFSYLRNHAATLKVEDMPGLWRDSLQEASQTAKREEAERDNATSEREHTENLKRDLLACAAPGRGSLPVYLWAIALERALRDIESDPSIGHEDIRPLWAMHLAQTRDDSLNGLLLRVKQLEDQVAKLKMMQDPAFEDEEVVS